MPADPKATEQRFLELLDRAFSGWQRKIEADFSAESMAEELASLKSDALYTAFGLAVPEYALIRLMGRISISIGRRLGELYDNLPRFVAAAHFSLTPDDVAAQIDGLDLDLLVPREKLSPDDDAAVRDCVRTHLDVDTESHGGLGVEIRYNFNPNDSARLRKDVAMAAGLEAKRLIPVYLIYSGISPRHEAIERLTRAGWIFQVGDEASAFTKCLLGLDLSELLGDADVQATIKGNVDAMMTTLMDSAAVEQARESAAARPHPE